jgi:thioredoxin-dependent peroxiredoxin
LATRLQSTLSSIYYIPVTIAGCGFLNVKLRMPATISGLIQREDRPTLRWIFKGDGMKLRHSIAGAVAIVLCTAGSIRVLAADSSVKTGMPAPSFTLPSQENTPVSLSDYKGKWVVLYFYPKDMSSGCTIQAHTYQNKLAKFEANNAVVLGVSRDTADSHKTFCAHDGLTFKLLADPEGKVASQYGVAEMTYKGMKFDERDTVLIRPDGSIAQIWRNVDPRNDSDIVLAEIAKLHGQAGTQ